MVDIKEVIKKCTKYKEGKPLSSFKLMSQSDANQLEPIYYWILDFLQDAGVKLNKVTDNFTASPGSGQFQDFSQRQSQMMAKAGEYMGAINQVTKSILNLIYDLKEFEIRLEHYKRARSKDEKEKEEGMLALKQIWLDNVDLKRGRGSIHQMAYEMGFTTLREAFLVANSVQDVEDLATEKKGHVINDSVKRVLIPRISEFLIWKDLSEKELVKRFEIEKTYLKSQVETLKLYTKWARPYLEAQEKLGMKGFENNASLVNVFSTSMFQLTLLGKREVKKAPEPHQDYKLKRKYFEIFLIDMQFRGHVGQKVTQKGDYGFAYGGRVDMTFDSYALNEEELKLVETELSKSDLSEGLKFLQDGTATTLKQLEDDINHFVFDDIKQEEKKKDEKKDEKKQDDINPFSAILDLGKMLFGSLTPKQDDKKKEIKEVKDIEKDNYVEGLVRKKAEESSKDFLFATYDVYKKAHGMASSPEKFDNQYEKS